MNYALKKTLIALAVLVVAAGFLALQIYGAPSGDNPLVTIVGKLGHLALFVLFWFAVYVVGRLVGRGLRGGGAISPDLATALGIAVYVVLAFFMCTARVAYPGVARAGVIVAAAAGVIIFRGELSRVPSRVRRWLRELEVASACLLLAGAAVALPIALAAGEPPFYWDALTYHLAVPKAYASAHGFTYLPYNVYASMPMGGSLFYLWPYLWDGLITAKASHLVATAIAVSLTYRLARRWLSQFYAAWASALVIFAPPVIVAIGGAHNDHFQIMFAAAALYVYFKREVNGGEARDWLAVGIFLGASVAVKYTAYAVGAAFVPIWVYDLFKKRIKISWVAKVLVVAFALILPWLVKAYVERGNPVFPLFYDRFGGRDFTAEQAERLLEWQGNMGRGRGIGDFFLMPYRVSVEADIKYSSFSGVYLPFLLPFAALAVVVFRRGGRIVAYGWLYLVAWFIGPQQLRFLGGALPAFGVAAAGVVAAAEITRGRWPAWIWRGILIVGLLLVSLPCFAGVALNATTGHNYLIRTDREEFLRSYVGFYRAQDFINRELPREAKILMVFTNHTLYLEREAVYDSFLEASPLLLAAEKADDGARLYELARGWGCTHVHVYHSYERRVWPYYEPRTRDVFYDFLNRYGTIVYEDQMNKVYELNGGAR